MPYYPAEWPIQTRAVNLKKGDFALLSVLGGAPVLVGEAGEEAISVILEHGEKGSNVSPVEALSGSAHRFVGVEFEIDPASGNELQLVNSPIGSLIIRGSCVSIAARPHNSYGFVAVEVGSLERDVESELAFAYQRWRIVKRDGDKTVVLFERSTDSSQDA